MAAAIPTDIGAILTSIKTKLIGDGVVPLPNCFMTLAPNKSPLPPGDRSVLLTPGTQIVRQEIVTGAGNTCMWVDGQITITIWNRLALDREGHRDETLTSSIGVLSTYSCVINSLQLYLAVDGSSNILLLEPMRMNSGSFDNKVDQVGRLQCVQNWEVSYMQRFSC